jgi:hypothetical protein
VTLEDLSRTMEEANRRWLGEVGCAVAEEGDYSLVIDSVVAASTSPRRSSRGCANRSQIRAR